jgi:adenosylhomocysteinase
MKDNKNVMGMRRGLPLTHIKNIEDGIDMSGHLWVLKELTEETKNEDNTHSVILQHILPTTVEYIDRVNQVYPVDLVIAICYSADPATIELLRKKGYNVYLPKDINDMLTNLWKLVVDLLEKNPYPLLIQEVGGYFSDVTEKLSQYSKFKGCVEDTNNGLWRYEEAEKKKGLFVPVISMADTPLKHVEDSLIGDACVYSLEKVMRTQMAAIIQGVRCGVIGWGHIGKSAASAFKGRHGIVSIYDINPVVDMLAYAEGYFPIPLKELLNEVDIVMGCSGRRSIRTADIDDLKEGIILCSASSKDIEFDLEGFKELCTIETITAGDDSTCAIQKYTVNKTGKFFYILDYGTPIDFLDMPLQGAILDCTCSELFVCMRELSENKHSSGIISLTENLQTTIAQKWLRIHSEVFSHEDAKEDKVFFFPESWNWT